MDAIEQKAREWLAGERDLDVHQLVRDLVARNTELELACAQAVEFATYVEEHAKGKMEAAARRFMSMEFAQELARVLKAGREGPAPEGNTDDKNLTLVEREVLAAAEEIRLAVRFSARPPTSIAQAEAKTERIRRARHRMLKALGATPAPEVG